MEWKTRITELFGCKYPILQGALSGIGKAEFAAAVSNAGAHGCITAGAYRTSEQLREAIRKYRELSAEPFSVNISVTHCPDEEGMLKVILEEGVPVLETAVYNADDYGKSAKDAGLKWIHKVATLKHALHAEEVGADAVIIVGLDGIGKKSISQLTTMTTLLWTRKFIKVPLVIAGGIGDGRGFLGALTMGADGIMMGTRFMATKECPISDRPKQGMVRLNPDNPELKHRCLNMPDPKEYEELMKLRGKIPMKEWIPKHSKLFLKDKGWREAAYIGPEESKKEKEQLGFFVSEAVAAINDIPSCKELIARIVGEAEEILEGMEFVKSKFAVAE